MPSRTVSGFGLLLLSCVLTASDALIDFMDSMFAGMEAGIDPRLLDCSIEPLLGA